MRLIETLKKIGRLVEALTKLIPTIIDILEDLGDDGKRNLSNRKA